MALTSNIEVRCSVSDWAIRGRSEYSKLSVRAALRDSKVKPPFREANSSIDEQRPGQGMLIRNTAETLYKPFGIASRDGYLESLF